MKIGFHTYPFIDVCGLPIEEVLEQIAKDGYSGIDISTAGGECQDPSLFPQESRRKYREVAEQLGLEIVAVATHLPMINAVWEGRPINIHGAIDLALDVNARMVLIHPGTHKNTNHTFDLAWESAVEHLTDVCRYAESKGINVVLDGIDSNSLLDTPEKVEKLIFDVGSAFLKHNFDPCRIAMDRADPIEAVSKLANFICHVHIKDFKGMYHKAQHQIPGDGKLNIKSIVSELKKIHYKGYLTIECFENHNFKRASQVGFRTLKRCI